MDEVIGGLNSRECGLKGQGFQDISLHDLGGGVDTIQQGFRTPGQAPNEDAPLLQERQQVTRFSHAESPARERGTM